MSHEPRSVLGTVSARWTGTSRALVTLDTGETVEAAGAEELADLVSPGDRVVVYFESDGRVAGWMLAEDRIGFNFRQGGP